MERPATTEHKVWTGSPSHIVNLPVYLLCGLLFFLIIPLFIGIWKWLVLRNIKYELTTERLRVRQGVLNKHLDELELYRVRDYKLERPLLLRLFSLANITLRTTDSSHPLMELRAIRNGEEVREFLRHHVEECRVRKRVLPLDLDQT